MRFDSNLAWKQGSALVRGNRDLLLTLAGVFFFLPSFALIMLIKQPQIAPGATSEVVMAQLEPFIAGVLPWAVLGSVVQSLGQLTLVDLFGQGQRSTVGEALRKALWAFPGFFVAQMLTGLMMGGVLTFVAALGSAISPLLGLIAAVYGVCLVYGRFMLVGPVIVAERQRNPFVALGRSLALTRGNAWRIGNFLFLLASAFFMVFIVLTLLVGIVAAVSAGEGRVADILTGFVSSAVSALALAWFMGIIVAAHRQLAGATSEPSQG
jgi:hypothetical protein